MWLGSVCSCVGEDGGWCAKEIERERPREVSAEPSKCARRNDCLVLFIAVHSPPVKGQCKQ